MKIDDSNKRYSMIIAGILLITVLPILVAFTLGVLGQKSPSVNSTCPIGAIANIQNKTQGIDELVLGSKRDCDTPCDWHTKPGSIQYEEISQDCCYELPLCIKGDDDLEGLNKALNITLRVCGGYEPINDSSILYLTQKGTTYQIYIRWTSIGAPSDATCCCEELWVASFHYKGQICLISSQTPDSVPRCCDPIRPQEWSCKDVDLKFDIYFEGCHFWIIPASNF